MLKPKHILLLLEWYDYRIHKGVAEMARRYGWHLHCPKNINERSFASEVLKSWKGDGCIAMIQCKETFQYLKSKNIPLIDLGLRDYGMSIPRLITDNKKIGKLAAEHLREFGHKEIFAIGHGKNMMFKERLNSLQAHSRSNDCTVTVLKSGTTIQLNTINEIESILKERGTTIRESSIAFFAYNDSFAADLISICLMNDIRVPENIAIIGVDNDDLIISSLVLGLSSVDSDQEGLGKSAAKLMQSLLDSDNFTLNEEIYRHPPKGVVTRRSTDCYAVRNPLVSNALHWIQNNFYKGIQATDVAAAMNVTQQGLQKAFANNYIRSPGNEIRHQRLEAVAFLLKTTGANLDTIAKNCGFYSVNSLINSFRKKYNKTPGKFREYYKKSNKKY